MKNKTTVFLLFGIIISILFAACSLFGGIDEIHENAIEENKPKTPLTGTPVIIGDKYVNAKLTATAGTLNVKTGLTYQWKRGDINIGSNSSTYTVVAEDKNQNITVTVTHEGFAGSVTSDAFNIPNNAKTGIYSKENFLAIPNYTGNQGIEYILCNNITLDDNTITRATGMVTNTMQDASFTFYGTFDGNGKQIDIGSQTFSMGSPGLFGSMQSGSKVKNLKMKGAIIYSGGSTNMYIGALASQNSGTILNVSSRVTVAGTHTGSGDIYAGGLVGRMSSSGSSIVNCYTYNGDTLVSASGGSSQRAGGIIGSNEGGTVQYCWTYGKITTPTTSGLAGGIAGSFSSGVITCCVALNSSVQGYSMGRITTGSPGGLSKNFAKTDMWLPDYGNQASGGTMSNKNGADVSDSTYISESWWNTGSDPGWSAYWGGTENPDKPWKWSTNLRPVLWFEADLYSLANP